MLFLHEIRYTDFTSIILEFISASAGIILKFISASSGIELMIQIASFWNLDMLYDRFISLGHDYWEFR